MDRKIILWSVTLFFACMILFYAIDQLAASAGKGISIAIQAAVMAAIIAIIVVVGKRKS